MNEPRHEPAHVIVADPWGASAKNLGELSEVMRAPLPPIADNAFLLLWQPPAMHEEALHVIRAWDFDLKSEIVWVRSSEKEDSIGGGCFRNVHEVALLCGRGKVRAKDKAINSIFDTIFFFEKRSPDGTKPDMIYKIAERLAGDGPFVEIYGRKARAGWHVYGPEIGYVWTPAGETPAPAPNEDITREPPQLPILSDDDKRKLVTIALEEKIENVYPRPDSAKDLLQLWPDLVANAPAGWFQKGRELLAASKAPAASAPAATTTAPSATSDATNGAPSTANGANGDAKRKPGRPRLPRCATCGSKLTETALGPFCKKGCDQKKPISDAWKSAAERAHSEEMTEE